MFTRSTKFPPFFSNLEPYDARPKLAHAYCVFPLVFPKLCRWKKSLPSLGLGCEWPEFEITPLGLILSKCDQMHFTTLFSCVCSTAGFSFSPYCIGLIFRHVSSILFVGFPVYSISAVIDFVFGYKHSLHVTLRGYSRHQSPMSKINLNRHTQKENTNKTEKSTFTTTLVIVKRKNGSTGAIPTGGAEWATKWKLEGFRGWYYYQWGFSPTSLKWCARKCWVTAVTYTEFQQWWGAWWSNVWQAALRIQWSGPVRGGHEGGAVVVMFLGNTLYSYRASLLHRCINGYRWI